MKPRRIIALLMLAVAGARAEEPAKTKPWLTTMQDATEEARRLRQPIFVEVGAISSVDPILQDSNTPTLQYYTCGREE